MDINRLFVVFAIEHYNPLGAIRSLGEEGIRPVYIAVKGKARLASLSKYVSKCHFVDTVEDGFEVLLSEYGNYDVDNKPILYYTDDRTLGYMDDHYDEIKDKFICFNAGKSGRINEYINKEKILEVAKDCGLNCAETEVCAKGEIPAGLHYPIITKSISPNVGGWKSDVFICKSEPELKAAYEKIKAPTVLLQSYIEKKNELEYYGVSINHGNDVLFTVAENYRYLIDGYYSPYMNVFKPPFPDIQAKIAAVIKKVGFEGIFSVEFLVDDADNLYFLEINFRNATWSYASTCVGMNLLCLWAEGMLTGKFPVKAHKDFEQFTAMVEPVDYGKRVETGEISIAEWAKDFKETKCTYYYNEKDMFPFESLYENWDLFK